MKSKPIIILFILQSFAVNQTIGEGLYLNDLINYLNANYKPNNVLSYNSARDVLYGDIEAQLNNGEVFGIYTNYSVNLPNSVDPSSYLYDNGIYNYRIVAVSGALEAAPAACYADLIADLTATGTTLRANNLKQINEGTVLRSQACLIGNPESINNNKYKFELTTKLIDLIKSNIRAEEYYRLTANVLCDSEENLAALILSHPDISGLHGPTLSRLHNKSDMSWFSVSVVVPKYNLSSCVSQIRECGGVSIAASKIDYLFNEEVVENDRIFIA